ncbi:hypothetical protein ACFL1A_01395 [Patescibacteria group bacterium]
MKKHITIFNSLILTLILAGGLGLFVIYKGNQFSQLVVGITISLSYFFWGMIYHKIRGDLHNKVVLEYSLISLISILVFMIVLRF